MPVCSQPLAEKLKMTISNEIIHRTILWLAIFAVTCTAGLAAKNGYPTKPAWWVLLVWECLPYWILIFVAGKVKKGKTALIIILFTLVAVMTGGGYMQLQAMRDAQGGLIILFLAGYQLVAAGIGAVVAGVVRRD